jgi:hypothetical protein
MQRRTWLVGSLLFFVPSLVSAQDLLSGPDVGKPVPGVSVLAATGPNVGNEIDYTDQRNEKPTVYVFVQADKWDRPMARFLRGLDEAMPRISQDAYVVAIWLTADQEKTKQYLPVAQQSLQFTNIALTQFTGEASGPANWKLHSGAHLTAVVVAKEIVSANFAYRSVNETVVDDVVRALKTGLN